MYTRLGQTENTVQAQAAQNQPPPAWAQGVSAILNPLAQATTQVFQAKTLSQINKERAKLGLPPLSVAPPGALPEPASEESGTSPLVILVVLALVGGGLYFLSKKK